MRNALLPFAALALVPFLLLRLTFGVGPPPRPLSEDDRKFLDGLIGTPLFDPKAAERVMVPVEVRDAWGRSRWAIRAGWYRAAQGKQPARVYFTDGYSIPAPWLMVRVNFIAASKRRLAAPRPHGKDADWIDERFDAMTRTRVGEVVENELVLAAWLYRRGEERLAARALAGVADRKEAVDLLRSDLKWAAFAQMIHAYIVRADEEATAHGERLLRLYRKEGKASEWEQKARALLAELARRKKKGTFGQAPARLPAGLTKWEGKKKIAYLIDALEEVDARQDGQPGGVDLGSDPRVAALIGVGDAAVPALIDTLEKDTRLTRSVHFWRDFSTDREVLGVREAALTALMSILRVRFFEPVGTGDRLSGSSDPALRQTVQEVRAYWKKFGHLPFDERMMKVLTDPKAQREAWREAVTNLAELGRPQRPLSTMFAPVYVGGYPARARPHPVLNRFRNPTAAEAILAALDRDLKALDGGKRDSLYEYYRDGIEATYLNALLELRDTRVLAEVVKRAKAAKGSLRRRWAYTAHWLGDSRLLNDYARAFAAGKIDLPLREARRPELRAILGTLIAAGTPDCERALQAVTYHRHPVYDDVNHAVLTGHIGWYDYSGFFSHPFCLSYLRQALDDRTLTGGTWRVEEGELTLLQGNGRSASGLPEFLADPKVRREEAAARACDDAAEKVQQLVFGAPRYHPLLKDADRRLTAMKELLDRYKGRMRPVTKAEWEQLKLSGDVMCLPDIVPLRRPATAADVKAGRAVFHLGGKGKVANLKLPVVRTVRDELGQDVRALVIQAEVGPDGKTTWGVLTRHGLRAIEEKASGTVRPQSGSPSHRSTETAGADAHRSPSAACFSTSTMIPPSFMARCSREK